MRNTKPTDEASEPLPLEDIVGEPEVEPKAPAGARYVDSPFVVESSPLELVLLKSLVRGEVDRLRPLTVKRGLSPAMKQMAVEEHERAVQLLAKLCL